MDNLSTKQKIFLGVLGGIVVIILLVYVFSKDNSTTYVESEQVSQATTNTTVESENIVVHIAGQVENEGVLELKPNARVNDAIEEAGGLTSEADISQINLASVVKDGQKIYIPSKDEVEEGYTDEQIGQTTIKEVGKIDINTATQTELETLSGIGASTALKIINYRAQNGNFGTIEDIKNVPGIGNAKFESIKDSITVN